MGIAANIQPASILGKVKDQKRRKPLEGVAIITKRKTFTKTTTTDSTGNYSIADLESGKYTLTAKKSGYKVYKKKVILAAGKETKLNIRLQKKKPLK